MKRAASVFVFFTAATWVLCYPLSTSPGEVLLDPGPDARLYLWTLAWDVHAAFRSPLHVFDANIFFPETKTLAYSEHLLASALLAAPWIRVSGNPILGMNVVLLLSCIVCGVGAYFLARTLGASVTGALASGIVFAFAPPRFFRLAQVHLAAVGWMPLCLAFLHRYARGGSRRDALAAAAFFSLQALSGGYTGLFLTVTGCGLAGYLALTGEFRPRSQPLRDLAIAGSLAIALNVSFLLPYYEVRRDLGLTRTLAEAEAFSPNAPSFLAAPTHVQERLLPRRFMRRASGFLFPGFVTIGLAVFALRRREPLPPASTERTSPPREPGPSLLDGAILTCFARLLSRAKREAESRVGLHSAFYAGLAVFSLWAALGPRFGLYGLAFRLVPGFDFIRVPARLTILTLLALAVLAAAGVDRVKNRVLRAGLLLALVLEFAAAPLDTTRYHVPSSTLDAWLARQPGDFGVVNLPVADPRDGVRAAQLHSLYMLQSLAHFKHLVNGYSGFTPPAHDALFRKLVSFPNEESLDVLEAWGVRYALLHRSLYAEREWQALSGKLETYRDRLELVWEDGDGRVYALTRSRTRANRKK